MTYEGARSITGPYLGLLGASATVVGIVSGFGELIGYAMRLLSGWLGDRTQRYWAVTIAGYLLNLVAVPLLAAVVLAWTSHPAIAQTKEARGRATTVTDTALTVDVNGTNMKFAVDNNTIVGAPGAGRATRDAQGKGAAGAKLTAVLKPGTGVIVTYREAAGSMVATASSGMGVPLAANATGRLRICSTRSRCSCGRRSSTSTCSPLGVVQ